jgi:hypothetical protein
MRNIKLFEIFNIRENTKDDIFGIFVELQDIGYKIEVDIDKSRRFDGCTSGDQIFRKHIYICISKDEFNYDLEIIGEYMEMLEDYLKTYLDKYEIIYRAAYMFSYSTADNLESKYMGKTYNEFMKKNHFWSSKLLRQIRILIIEE